MTIEMMEKEEEATEQNQEEENASENEANQEDNDNVDEQTDEQDTDGGGEAGEVQEDDKGDGEESSEEETKIDPRDQKISLLEKEIQEIKQRSSAPVQPAPAPLTEEQKAEIEQRFGGMPFAGITAINSMFNASLSKLEKKFIGELSGFRKDSAITNLSQNKEFSDIRNYIQGVNEYLNKYPKEHHANEELIKDAYYYAKGKGLKKAVSRAVNTSEKNRRVATMTKTSSTGITKTTGKKSGGFQLTPTEEQVWATTGKDLFSSREEYARSLPRYRNKK